MISPPKCICFYDGLCPKESGLFWSQSPPLYGSWLSPDTTPDVPPLTAIVPGGIPVHMLLPY